jgi:hypothetical protein
MQINPSARTEDIGGTGNVVVIAELEQDFIILPKVMILNGGAGFIFVAIKIDADMVKNRDKLAPATAFVKPVHGDIGIFNVLGHVKNGFVYPRYGKVYPTMFCLLHQAVLISDP